MANTSAPFGLRPVRNANGTPWTGKPGHYYLPTSDTHVVFIGDPVDVVGTSNTTEVVCLGGTFPPGTLQTVTHATLADTNFVSGVVVGFEAVTRDSTTYREASTDRIALIAPAWDPNIVFRLRDDGSGVIGTALVGANANLVAGAGGSTVTGKSTWMLDATTPAADATFQVTILRAANIFDNDATLASAVWDVQINLPQPFPAIVGFA